ncbi:MAG: hypothetical protein K2Y05_05415 [Hyphomicrobiaceae bacterium]|nr:hypothetical protein [Hyphomicrobiaceae bacterium]
MGNAQAMTINTIMLVALGFLVATLLAVIVAPAYRNRTMRLTTDALRRSLPLTESEIRADRDRMRAEHAIRIHNLETQLERVTLGSARQKIEVNRRDARISELEGLTNTQTAQLEELDNAKRVLEQTITDRLPKIEGRLNEARKLLQQRDNEVTALADTAQRQARAIAEATQINTQQGTELEQLRTALSTRAARNTEALADQRFDGEIALRSEIEALRAKSRDQTSLIERLQSVIANPASGAEPGVVAAVTGALGAASKATLDASAAEFTRLQAEFGDLKSAYALARAKAEAAEAETTGARSSEAELRKLKSERQDLTAEVARLKAALTAYEDGPSTERGGRESPIAMKSKISALEVQTREQTSIIESLRAEIAAVNERLARQAAHYMEEMKKLGAGSIQTSSGVPRTEPKRSTLADRINDPRVVRLSTGPERNPADTIETSPTGDVAPAARMFSLVDAKAGDKAAVDVPAVAPSPSGQPAVANPQPSLAAMASTAATASGSSVAAINDKPRRPRLLERITSIEKSGGE